MNASKHKAKPARKTRSVESAFVAQAQRDIRKAQQTAARENARYGLRLIVQDAH